MKSTKLIISYLIVIPTFCFSQINYDSIYQVVQGFSQETAQLQYLDSLLDDASARRIITNDSLYYLLIELNQRNNDLDSEVKNAASLAYHYYLDFQDKKALDLFNQYNEKIDQVSNLIYRAYIYHKFGIILKIFNRDNDAIEYFDNAILIFDEIKDSTLENYGNALVEKGGILLAQGEFAKSSVALNRAKEIYEHNRDSSGMRVLYREFFILFSSIELYEEAQRYSDLVLDYLNDSTDQEDYFILTNNTARNLLYQEKYEEAITKYLSVEKIDYPYGKLYLYNGLIEGLYFGNKRDSIDYYYKTLEKEYARMNHPEEFKFLFQQSRFLYRLKENKYSLAERDVEALMDHALSINDVTEIMMYNRFFSELYQRKGDFRKALEYSNAYIEARDSIQAANKSNALLLYQTKYETQEKENKIQQLSLNTQLLQSRISRNRLQRILLISMLGILLLGGFLIYNRLQVRQLAKMQELRTNISSDLHDEVGSLLSGISMQADIVKTIPDTGIKANIMSEIGDNTREAMTKMRDLVWSIDSRRDKIKDLKDKIAETCSKLLPPTQFKYYVEVKSDLNIETKLNPEIKKEIYLICKEALNNIYKHSNGDEVRVRIAKSGKSLEVTIWDNGIIGEKKFVSTGQGLDNMKRRAKKLGGSLKINQAADHFEVMCEVPF